MVDVEIRAEHRQPTVIPKSVLVDPMAPEIFGFFDPPLVTGVVLPESEARCIARRAVERALAATRLS